MNDQTLENITSSAITPELLYRLCSSSNLDQHLRHPFWYFKKKRFRFTRAIVLSQTDESTSFGGFLHLLSSIDCPDSWFQKLHDKSKPMRLVLWTGLKKWLKNGERTWYNEVNKQHWIHFLDIFICLSYCWGLLMTLLRIIKLCSVTIVKFILFNG